MFIEDVEFRQRWRADENFRKVACSKFQWTEDEARSIIVRKSGWVKVRHHLPITCIVSTVASTSVPLISVYFVAGETWLQTMLLWQRCDWHFHNPRKFACTLHLLRSLLQHIVFFLAICWRRRPLRFLGAYGLLLDIGRLIGVFRCYSYREGNTDRDSKGRRRSATGERSTRQQTDCLSSLRNFASL